MYEAVETLKLRCKPPSKNADSLRKHVDCLATEATSRTYSTTSLNKTLRDRVKRMQTSRSAHAYHDTPQQCRRPPRMQHESAASGCLFFSGSSKTTSETKGNIAQIDNKKGRLKALVKKDGRNKQVVFERNRSDKLDIR